MCGYSCIGFIDFMLKGKSLTDFTNLFSPNSLEDNDEIILKCIKSGAVPMVYPDLNNQAFKLNKINEIKDYCIAEICERELMSKRLSKYIAAFDYFDKSLIALSVASAGVSLASFARVIGAAVRIARVSFSFAFSLTRGIAKKLLKTTQNKKKKT